MSLDFIAVCEDGDVLTYGELRSDGSVVFPESEKPGTITGLIAPSGYYMPVEDVRGDDEGAEVH